MLRALFGNVSEEDKNTAIQNIVGHATPRQDFFVMMGLSVAMAVFGILLDSIVILIGSMLIAPLLYPLLSFALGVITTDSNLMARSFSTITKSVGYGLVVGFVIGFVFSNHDATTIFPNAVISSSLMYSVVAVIAGFAAALAMTKPHLNETLPGVAISVALVPPLATAGIGLALFEWQIVSDSLLLFIVNAIGIVFSSMIVFSLFRFAVKQRVAAAALKKVDEVVKQEAEMDHRR